MSEGAFVDQYLKYDEANDYVMKTLPCPFLLPDNACSIYEFRPIDCSNYPHTRGLDYSKRTNYQSENVAYCPISYHVAISIINQLNEKNQRKI
jgi:Fe-S-cluster containining protein